jgi:hypothetical protein
LVLVHKKYGVSDISELVKIENLNEESEVEE